MSDERAEVRQAGNAFTCALWRPVDKHGSTESRPPEALQVGRNLEGERPREPSGVSQINLLNWLLGAGACCIFVARGCAGWFVAAIACFWKNSHMTLLTRHVSCAFAGCGQSLQ